MRKKLSVFMFAILFLPTLALGQGGPNNWSGGLPLGNGKWLTGRAASNQTEVQILRVNPSGNVEFGASLDTDLSFNSGGYGVKYPAGGIITPATAVTAVGAAPLTNRTYYVATAAPTAVYGELPSASLSVGETRKLINWGASPFQIMPSTGNTINQLGAATPFACATGKHCSCEGLTTGIWGCVAQ